MDVRSIEPELRSLMVAGLEGDAAAHRMLLEKLSVHLRGYFKAHLSRYRRDPVEAEDLVQEVLIAIHTRRHTYDRSQLLTPWVYAIARYKFSDYLRRSNGSIKDVPIEEVEVLTAFNDSAQVESNLDLEKLLARISPKARQVIKDVKLEGLSVSEAAARSGMSESAVKVAIHRGLRTLATMITKRSRHEDRQTD